MTFTRPIVYGTPHPKIGIPMGLPERPDAAPDMAIDGADFPGLTVRAASLRGDDHRYYGTTRQDAMGLWRLRAGGGPDVLLVCVADGVGSQPDSHVGSALACRALHEECAPIARQLLDPDDGAFEALVERVAKRVLAAVPRDADPVAFATTLTAALVEMTPSGPPRHCVVFGVGDSPALLLREGSFTPLLKTAAQDEVMDTRTAALPLHMGKVTTAVAELGADDTLVICTDGLTGPMRDEKVQAQMADWWCHSPVPDMLEFAWQLAFRAKSHTDDRTAVCVWGS